MGVTAVAVVFLGTAGYLLIAGSIMLISPGAISMAAGADLLGGLETWGACMFLLTAAAGIAIGIGLLRLQNWARRLAAIAAMIGIIMLIPRVSTDVIGVHFGSLTWSALGMIVRVLIVFYLYQAPTRQLFEHAGQRAT
jgi:hypothetical protein